MTLAFSLSQAPHFFSNLHIEGSCSRAAVIIIIVAVVVLTMLLILFCTIIIVYADVDVTLISVFYL